MGNILMFSLVKVIREIRLNSKEISKQHSSTITKIIEDLFSEKAIVQKGLIVIIYNVFILDHGFLNSVNGSICFPLHLSLVIFKPIIGEIVTARIIDCTDRGLQLSMGFFDNIFITPEKLGSNCEFDIGSALWIWQFTDMSLIYGLGDTIRFRVAAVIFPTMEHKQLNIPILKGIEESLTHCNRQTMVVLGETNESGLGDVRWWKDG